jgi:acetyl/propionyl-CoA carboxylase alpha subunit
MIYLVEIEGQDALKVELAENKRGVFTASVADGKHDGQSVELEMRGRDEDGAYLFAIGGEIRKFHLDKNCTKHLLDDGESVSRFQVERAGDVVLNHDSLHDTEWEVQIETLESNITGIVLEILVEPGQTVNEGDPIVVVEAMKMENTLTAAMDSTVAEIAIESGQTVYAGDTLVKFK